MLSLMQADQRLVPQFVAIHDADLRSSSIHDAYRHDEEGLNDHPFRIALASSQPAAGPGPACTRNTRHMGDQEVQTSLSLTSFVRLERWRALLRPLPTRSAVRKPSY
jgi:hypothetical protein